jgi:hypothetical protein
MYPLFKNHNQFIQTGVLKLVFKYISQVKLIQEENKFDYRTSTAKAAFQG